MPEYLFALAENRFSAVKPRQIQKRPLALPVTAAIIPPGRLEAPTPKKGLFSTRLKKCNTIYENGGYDSS
jgi:hypothetical protein